MHAAVAAAESASAAAAAAAVLDAMGCAFKYTVDKSVARLRRRGRAEQWEVGKKVLIDFGPGKVDITRWGYGAAKSTRITYQRVRRRFRLAHENKGFGFNAGGDFETEGPPTPIITCMSTRARRRRRAAVAAAAAARAAAAAVAAPPRPRSTRRRGEARDDVVVVRVGRPLEPALRDADHRSRRMRCARAGRLDAAVVSPAAGTGRGRRAPRGRHELRVRAQSPAGPGPLSDPSVATEPALQPPDAPFGVPPRARRGVTVVKLVLPEPARAAAATRHTRCRCARAAARRQPANWVPVLEG